MILQSRSNCLDLLHLWLVSYAQGKLDNFPIADGLVEIPIFVQPTEKSQNTISFKRNTCFSHGFWGEFLGQNCHQKNGVKSPPSPFASKAMNNSEAYNVQDSIRRGSKKRAPNVTSYKLRGRALTPFTSG